MQDCGCCDYFRTPVIFQGLDIYRFGGAITKKAGPIIGPAYVQWRYYGYLLPSIS